MAAVVRVEAGLKFGGGSIRPAFENTGFPGYFTIETGIPPEFMDAPVPVADHYTMVFESGLPCINRHHLRPPTVEEVLWVVGFMSVPLTNVITGQPTRFLHRPFKVYMSSTYQGPRMWRQLTVQRFNAGYLVGTVPASSPVGQMQLGFVIRRG